MIMQPAVPNLQRVAPKKLMSVRSDVAYISYKIIDSHKLLLVHYLLYMNSIWPVRRCDDENKYYADKLLSDSKPDGLIFAYADYDVVNIVDADSKAIRPE